MRVKTGLTTGSSTMATQRKKLGEILVEWGIINAKEQQKAADHAKAKNMRMGEALQDLKLASESNVFKALATQHNMEFIDLDKSAVAPNAVTLVPDELMKKHLILPLSQENGKLKIAICDPLDLETLDILRFRLNKEIRTVLAPKSRIKRYLDDLYNSSAANSIDKTIDIAGMGEDAMSDPTQAPIIKLVHAMIVEAVRNRASDIHVEPMKDRVRVRYRIDGECVERDRIPLRMKNPLIQRLKIMAGIDIAEKRLPQDGRIKLPVDKHDIDFRVSTLPSYHGESVVLRILRPDSVRIGIQNLGFEEDDYKAFQRIIKRPNGIFLVTGPTGSGKTTTLYGALNELNRPDKKIITAEDPVEYNFIGINQCQVKENIGLTFAKILRSMLRQAPNIILVGEIRDLEVADVAIQAALTGHLVFSTLHTNDAPGAITRLIDMGVKPFLVASSIQAVLGQRLIRVLCPKCKQHDKEPDKMWLKLCGITENDMKDKQIFRPRGCDYCTGTGFRGRIGIFEMMAMNTQLRELAFDRAPTNKIRKAALASGMKSLLQDGKLKVLNGSTTAEEIVKVAQVEGIVTMQ